MSRTHQRETTPLGAEKVKIPLIPPFSKGEVGVAPGDTPIINPSSILHNFQHSTLNVQHLSQDKDKIFLIRSFRRPTDSMFFEKSPHSPFSQGGGRSRALRRSYNSYLINSS